MNQRYYVICCVRDAEENIESVMQSIVNQTVLPSKIIIVNDGSTDKTPDILQDYKQNHPELIQVLHTDSTTRDYTRIPKLWNMCLHKEYDFHMIAAGDTIFAPNYAEIILKKMYDDPKIVICSGYHGKERIDQPHGGGRFVRQSFFFKYYEKYPEKIGYETQIVYQALIHNYKIAVFKEAKFDHAEKLGTQHNFVEFGQAMRAMGFHPLYVLGRCFLEIIKNDNVGRRGSLNMLWYYLRFKPQKDGYYSLFSEDFRKNLRNLQTKEIKQLIKKCFKLNN